MKHFWQDIASFQFENLTWIRPSALWLFVLLAVWLLIHLLSIRQKHDWQKHIATSLQPYVITRGSAWRNQWPFLGFLLAMCFGVLALAGPSWQQEELPESKVSAELYIGLSVSPSMLSEDLQPNRLERGKLKLASLLKANPGVAAGVYVYAGTPHLLLPPTTDYVLINQQLENLNPGMMPLQGNNPALLFQQLDSTFERMGAPGTLVWMTDQISEQDTDWLRTFTERTPHQVEVFLLSTEGNMVDTFRDMNKVTLNRLTLDDSDVEAIAQRVRATRDFYLDPEDQSEQRRDMGLILIWPMLVLIAISFRKGAVIYSLVFFMMFGSSCSYDQKWADLWYSQDKIGYEYYKVGEYEKALEYLEDPNYRSLAYYRLGDYTAAAELSQSDSSASGRYNLGLALFNLGLYDEAAEAFNEATRLNPDLQFAQDAALTATRYAEENTMTEAQEEIKKEISGAEIVEDIGRSQELSEEEFGKEEDKDDPNKAQNEGKIEPGQETGKEAEKPDLSEAQEDQMESKDILLRKTAADPSDFLRKRFKMQKDRDYPDEQ